MNYTLEQALKTNKAIIVDEKAYTHNGQERTRIFARRENGKRHYFVIRYENGMYSKAI